MIQRLLIVTAVTALTVVVSLSGGLLLLSGSKLAKLFQKYSVPFAALVLLYAAFGDILPEVVEDGSLTLLQIFGLTCLGFVVCAFIRFCAGRFHHHNDSHSLKNKPQAIAMLIVDSLHTLADGVVLGLAFASSLGTGCLAALATAAHEIPQEIGDFSIMIRSKIPKSRILKLQFFSGLLLVPMTILSFFIGDAISRYLPIVLSLIAGNLIYIAVVEIWSMIKVKGEHHDK